MQAFRWECVLGSLGLCRSELGYGIESLCCTLSQASSTPILASAQEP